MGSVVSSKKNIKQKETSVYDDKKEENRPVSGVSVDSGYRSPEIHGGGNKINKFSFQENISLQDSNLLDEQSPCKAEELFDIKNNLEGKKPKNVPIQTYFTEKKCDENIYFLSGIDNDTDNEEYDQHKDSLRNIFIPGAVFNYDRIINDGKAEKLVARIEEEKKKNTKIVKRPQTAISTDIEIDLEKGTEKIRHKLPSLNKTKTDENTRDPKVRPRAARGQRRKTVSSASELTENVEKDKKIKERKSFTAGRNRQLDLMDACKMIFDQKNFDSVLNRASDTYKIDITVDMNSEVLKIVLPGSYLFGAK